METFHFPASHQKLQYSVQTINAVLDTDSRQTLHLQQNIFAKDSCGRQTVHQKRMRYLFDGNLMITEAQTLAADIPTDGSYDMCSYILDFDTRNCTEFTLQTPYNNRPVYVLTTIGDACYVATDYKTYTPTSVSEDGTVSNFDYVANIYAFITKQDYINSNQNGYSMVKDAFE